MLFYVQFVYVNSAFSPNPDELVNDLYNVSAYLTLLSYTVGILF